MAGDESLVVVAGVKMEIVRRGIHYIYKQGFNMGANIEGGDKFIMGKRLYQFDVRSSKIYKKKRSNRLFAK